MKAKQRNWAALLAAIVAGATLSCAAETTLKVGDHAPKLQTGKWVQGEPVKDFEKGKAYIVEFWATWCGPCRASIPHLNETYIKYKDKNLVVIGQNCWERDESLVAPFVKSMGEKMTYRVALDDKTEDKQGAMAQTWMAAAGRNGIPSAFLVDTKGVIAWIGHPMQLKEQVIEDVLAGKFDTQRAAADYEQAQKNESQLRTVGTALTHAMQNQDWDEALAKVDEMEKLMPADQRSSLEMVRFNILLGKEDYPAAYKLAAKVSEDHLDEPMVQNELAWQIATGKGIKERDLKLADTIATRGNDAAKGKDPAILDTLARVKFMEGKKDDAIALQEKAVQAAQHDEHAQYQKTLDAYKKGEIAKADEQN
jgi:thiol-disulfide isomerase/thioredoxin